ncbi:MAG TPA: putative toxin-antitoxin system toxin component, PIN family [Actinomycetota bacterium]|nr:putative toxin-antitoxin system toxin component, PIN family [Actinomycetota bacterium]
MRVLLDTNVLISAFIFPGGAPEAVYRMALRGRIEVVTSATLLAEFGRVLVGKFGWDEARADRAVVQVARVAEVVDPQERVAVVTADPADDRVLEAALEGAATAIVSGDRHLLRLGSWRGIAIVDPATFLTSNPPSSGAGGPRGRSRSSGRAGRPGP